MQPTTTDYTRPLLGALSIVSAMGAVSARRSVAFLLGSCSIASAIAAIRCRAIESPSQAAVREWTEQRRELLATRGNLTSLNSGDQEKIRNMCDEIDTLLKAVDELLLEKLIRTTGID